MLVEKIKILRKHHIMNQAEFSEIILSNTDRVSKVERGEVGEYSAKEVRLFCEHFGIVDMPLAEIDCIAFRKRLYMWRDLIGDKRLDEAKQWMRKMSAIVALDPCDDDLPVLYRLFEAMLHYYDRNIALFEEKMEALQAFVPKMSIEHTYYYEYCLGLVHSPSRFDVALIHYERAFDILKKHRDVLPEYDGKLLHNIALCYAAFEVPHHAIYTLNKISQSYIDKREQSFGLSVDMILALNTAKIGRFNDALDLLDKCLVSAKSLDSKTYLALTIYNKGYVYKLMKKWTEAISFLNQALEAFDRNNSNYMWALYHKIYCIIKQRKHPEAKQLIKQAIAAYPQDEIPFKSLEHYRALSKRMKSHYDYNREAVEYIEGVTIPYFRSIHDNMEAINYCNLLEGYYENKTHKKFLAMAKIRSEIYHKMLFYNQGGSSL